MHTQAHCIVDTDPKFVFTNSRGNWLWHSDTTRRGLRLAADGNLDLASAVSEIAQCRRLGHHLHDRVTEVYSHVAPEVEQRLLNAHNSAGRPRPRNAART